MAKYDKQITLGYDAEGKRIRKWIHADSQTELKRKEKELLMNWNNDCITSDMSFDKYSEKWFDTYKSTKAINTQLLYKGGLRKLESLNGKKMGSIRRTDLQNIIKENWEHPVECQRIERTMKQIFKAAVADGIISRSPATELELPHYVKPEKKFFTKAELKKIAKAELEPKQRLFVDVLRYLGLRPEEAKALGRVSFNKGYTEVTIDKAVVYDGNTAIIKGTKTGKARTLPVPDVLTAEIRAHAKANPSLYFFVNKSSVLMTRAEFGHFERDIWEGLNIRTELAEKITLYTFRHTRATELYYLTQTTSLSTKAAAAYMGHSELMFLRNYSHLDEEKNETEILKKVAEYPPANLREGKAGSPGRG